ncbi:HAMP domain-containing sensor histidine kinase [Gracilibacillus thailandensis]|uniref:histidine kinase n=1 Tax=Gracilibacillus thailandensis TaxID=563735 RepID=A0A6N7QVN9_9BACI|nr:HAMP domain-containing sensor histidine kinase [Gracilibacillus thailandensis]MRI64760.1 HAMP domain-containing protein [Gracilibacillus thailandensis]
MKIRTWLMISYLIVMLLPLAAAYGFFILVQEWDQSKRLVESLELYEQVEVIEEQLQSPDLYQIRPKGEIEDKLSEDAKAREVSIKLYSRDGTLVYQTDGESPSIYQVDRAQLFKGLYQNDLTYKSFTVKKPVYQDQEEQIMGIYEISIDRSEWVEGIEIRRNMMIVAFLTLFIFVYVVVIWMLNHKLNRPLGKLMNGMSSFATEQKPTYFAPKKKDEIGQLMYHFEQMQEKINAAQNETKQEQEEKQLMMASFSHDIKTPLTSLQAYAEALQEEQSLTEKERKEYLQIIKNKSSHLKGMIEDLTMYAKLQSTQYDMELIDVDAEEFFDMLFEGYDELARQHDIYLKKYKTITGICKMNDRQMIRYLDNLISNALRYTPQGASIGLAVVGPDQKLPDWLFVEGRLEIEQFRSEHALLIVQNDGPAIHDIESVFTPFFQGEEARTTYQMKNTGLGLSIARQIAEKHHGEMKLWSFDKSGTVIAMKFQLWKGTG